jgi:hypothetical protein
MTDRRTFIKGMFASAAATPLVRLVARSSIAVVNRVRLRFGKPMLNYGAWDSRYGTYDEAKKASDELTERIVRGF